MPTTSLTLTTYDSAVAFRDRALPFLVAQEAANNLMLGLTSTLSTSPRIYGEAPYFATVEQAGTVIAAALQTPPYNLILSTTEVPAALTVVSEDLHRAGAPLPGVVGPSRLGQEFARIWSARTHCQMERVRALRVFALRRVRPVTGVPGTLRRATRVDRDLILRWVKEFGRETDTDRGSGADRLARMVDARIESEHGGFFLWEVEGAPVSLIGVSGPTPNGIRIGPVYTPLEHRRHGFASAATATVSQHLLDAGRTFCFLFTDLANPTSNHIYQEIGYEPVCDVDEFEFRP